jgi:hypothetical protein
MAHGVHVRVCACSYVCGVCAALHCTVLVCTVLCNTGACARGVCGACIARVVRARGASARVRGLAIPVAPRLWPLTRTCPTGTHAHHAADTLERLLKLNRGFYPRCYYQICYHGTPTQNGGAVLYRFAKQI